MLKVYAVVRKTSEDPSVSYFFRGYGWVSVLSFDCLFGEHSKQEAQVFADMVGGFIQTYTVIEEDVYKN